MLTSSTFDGAEFRLIHFMTTTLYKLLNLKPIFLCKTWGRAGVISYLPYNKSDVVLDGRLNFELGANLVYFSSRGKQLIDGSQLYVRGTAPASAIYQK